MAASVAGGGILVTSAAFSVPGEVVAHQWEKHYISKSADEAKSVMLHCQVGIGRSHVSHASMPFLHSPGNHLNYKSFNDH